jgi:glycosyltransferase involved in cell wall biosynthesis
MTISKKIQDCNVIIVAHKFLTQPDDDLVLFLNKNRCQNVLHIYHSFADAQNRRSYFVWYKNGEIFKQKQSQDFKSGELLIYLKEAYFTLKWIWATRLAWDTYIGMDGLCSLFGLLFRRIGRVKKVVYWAIDFVPTKRFASGWKNKIYHFINVYGYQHVDEMWDLGVRMAEAREKFLGIKKSEYRFHQVVPYGVWTERIKKYSYEECEQNTLVFMGHLLEKQGVQLILAALPEIIIKIPQFKFKIIGDGSFKESLMKLAEKLGVASVCEFKGKIDNIKELEDEIAKSCVAVAPYVKKLDTWTYYADPGKIKTYLACGVPVVLTDIPWNAQEIVAAHCGLLIDEDKNDIVRQILQLMSAPINRQARQQAIKYANSFDYENIFGKLVLN